MKVAQIEPTITTYNLDKPVNLKTDRKYVFIMDFETQKLKIEGYYWFTFKNWVKKLFTVK